MKKVAVFGKPGSGKSTLSKALSRSIGVELYQLDSIVYQTNGEPIDRETFTQIHDDILTSDHWIIDGLGPIGAFRKRIRNADTLIYIDLPYPLSYWFVTKRLLKSLFIKPEGWPDGSSVIKGTIASYKMLKLSPTFWNAEFEQELNTLSSTKTVHIIRTISDLKAFVHQCSR